MTLHDSGTRRVNDGAAASGTQWTSTSISTERQLSVVSQFNWHGLLKTERWCSVIADAS